MVFLEVLVTGGGRQGEKGAGGVREVGEEGAGSRIPKVAGSGRKRENYATLRNTSESKKCEEAGANKYRAETGIKGFGKGGLTSLLPPPPRLNLKTKLSKLRTFQQPWPAILSHSSLAGCGCIGYIISLHTIVQLV